MQIFDIHTHSLEKSENALFNAGLDLEAISAEGWFSFGLHPWNVSSSTLDNDLATIEKALENPKVLAVGECGLDGLRGPSAPVQERAFLEQALLAKRHDRPMILHVVRKINDIIRIRKIVSPSRPWLIHGFRGKEQLMRQLLDLGFWLSFGNGAAPGSLRSVPDSRLVLETDGKCRIEDMQLLAAGLRGVEVSRIREISSTAAQDFLEPVCHFRK